MIPRLLLAAILIVRNSFENETTWTVTSTQGDIEGQLSYNGLYYEFLGIPYAVPVKFRAPKPAPPHEGIFKADNRLITCPQFPTNDPLTVPSDTPDCLILNIYVPKDNANNTLYPVMVFIHGGDFGTGCSSSVFYNPQYLVTQGVIVVTVNYRLNIYGFLNLGIEEAPGNAGLKDIRAALRWVNENISRFSGDADNVTVFGQGSGGTAAILLTMTESTKGLFKRIISQSGGIFTPQSYDPNPLKTAAEFAKTLEVNTEDANELFELYDNTPILKVEEALSKQMNSRSVFLPSVEKEFDDEEAFLTDTPFNILMNGVKNPVPLIIGLNTVEGLTKTLDFYTTTSEMDRILHEDMSVLNNKIFIPLPEEVEEYHSIIKETYFSNTTTDENVLGGLINYHSDFSFVGPISLTADMYANSTGLPVFQYIFNYIGNRNFGKLLTNSSLPATTHKDELFYIFELERLPLPIDENDARMATFMTQMWTNFAKFGSPTPDPSNGEWLPHPHHLAIELEPQYVTSLTPERAYFWRTLYFKYGADVSSLTVELLKTPSLLEIYMGSI